MKKKIMTLTLIIGLALSSIFLNKVFPIISSSVFAILIGMLLQGLFKKDSAYKEVVDFTSKKALRLAIILMGLGLSIFQVFEVGKISLVVMVFTLFSAFGGGYLIGKLFNMNWELSSLISAGTGICGGSAIVAIAPAIEAEDKDIAYAISATFIFDILMIIAFPLMGHYFNMSSMGYGLWTGTAINDTSSVVAAGYAFSHEAGQYALIVKLTRTLSIVPAVILFSMINSRVKNKGKSNTKKFKFTEVFPTFILFFLGMVLINSLGILSPSFIHYSSVIAKFVMLMALASIGLKTNFKEVSKLGIKPMLHGFIISLLVVVVSFVVQLFLHQI